jgi:hypothetical protein
MDFRHPIQKPNNSDTVYNWRPHELRPPLLAPYFPAFAAFCQELSIVDESASVSSDELRAAMKIIILSTEFYKDDEERHRSIRSTALFDYKRETYSELARPSLAGRSMFPDFHRTCSCPGVGDRRIAHPEFVEVKAEVDVGGSDPIVQAECDYVAVYTSAGVRPLPLLCPRHMSLFDISTEHSM